MLEAHDVAEAQIRLVPQLAATLRQRLGMDRMNLWFGPQVGWQVTADQKLQVLVGSTFVSECILRMFREDLRSVVSEVFGDGWGFELHVAQDRDALELDICQGDEGLGVPAAGGQARGLEQGVQGDVVTSELEVYSVLRLGHLG